MALALPRERGIKTPDSNYPFPSSPPELDPYSISYEILRWHDFRDMTMVLGDKVMDGGQKYDAVVSILRGGTYPGEKLAQRLFLPHDTLGLRSYRGIHTRGKIEPYQELQHTDRIKDAAILLVDDVNDYSDTLKAALQHLKDLGVANTKIAVLNEKPAHRDIKADFVVRYTNSWIVYAWEHGGGPLHERWEFFRERLPDWMISDEGEILTWDEVMHRCLAIGFLPDELPLLDNLNFFGWLSTRINTRYQEVFGTTISGKTGWHELFPGRDLPGPQTVQASA